MNIKNQAEAYPAETAGRLMDLRMAVVHPDDTVLKTRKDLIDRIANYSSINYIYVTDRRDRLIGVFSIKELFRSPSSRHIAEIMVTDPVAARAHTDQERIAHLALKHNIKELPVLDKEDRLLGVVSSDNIMQILNQEATEDVLRMGGIYGSKTYDSILKLPITTSLLHRLPWLLLGLSGGILTAGIVDYFQITLSRNIVLASFIPLIVYMAGAVGIQMETFIIRDLAVNPRLSFPAYFLRQLSVILLLSLLMSIILYGATLFLYGDPRLSLVLSFSLSIAIVSSVFTGLIVPFLFSKLSFDPANASGPVATIIQDLISVLVYLLSASILL